MDKRTVDHGFVVNCEVTIFLRRSHNTSCQVQYVQFNYLTTCSNGIHSTMAEGSLLEIGNFVDILTKQFS